MIPKEHGGWAMLLIPYVIGLGVAERIGLESLLFLAGILLVFLASEPLSVLVKSLRGKGPNAGRNSALRWLLIYLFLAGLVTVPVILLYGRWWLILFGVLGLISLGLQGFVESRRLDRTITGELVGALGLSLSAPGVYYATIGDLGQIAFLLWLLSSLHSMGSVLYVNLRLRHYVARGKCSSLSDRWALSKNTVVYLVVLIVVLIGLGYLGHVPLLALIAFVPLIYKAVRAIYRASPSFSFRRVGLIELASSAAFAALLIVSYVAS